MSDPEPSEPPSPASNADDDVPPRERGLEPTREHDQHAPRVAVGIADRTGRLGRSGLDELRAQASAVLAHAVVAGGGPARGEVRIEVIDDRAMSTAHAEYLDIEGTTDVLTFDLSGGGSAEGGPLDVDIMICLDEAGRQAAELGHPVGHEMTLYIVHGVLHCLGYDDTTPQESDRMHAEEDRLLEAAGIGAVYKPGGGASS